MTRTRNFLTLILVAVLAVFVTRARSADPSDDAEALRSLEPLGLPSVKGLQPVEVWTGGYSQGGDGARKERSITMPAFLVKDEEKSFTVLNLWLQQQQFTKDDRLANVHRVRYEARSIEWALTTLISQLELGYDSLSRDSPLPSGPVQLAMLVRHCRDFGQPALAEKFRAKLEEWFQETKRHNPTLGTLQEFLEPDLANYRLQTLLAEFRDPALSWSDIRDHLRAFLNHFKEETESDRARQLADSLTSLIEEERIRPILSHEQVQKLPKSKQAVELVRRLRLRGLPQNVPGDDEFDELSKLGMDAVPALIEVVDDHRPSRSVWFFDFFHGLHHNGKIESIGEYAVSAIGMISGRSFTAQRGRGVFSPSVPSPSLLRREIDAWWAEFQIKGERQFLIDAVSAGGPQMENQARQLIAKYPADAGTAILRGFARLERPTDRSNFLWLLASVDFPDCLELLRRELASGADIECRAAAAHALRKLGQPGGTEAMLAEWEHLLGQPHGEGRAGSVIQFLTSSQEPAVIKALVATLPARPVGARVEVNAELGGAFEKAIWNRQKVASLEVKQLIEATLVSSLQDDEEQVGFSGVGYRNPSVGDQAARRLSQILPAEYVFDIGASFAEKESARTEMQEHWHAKTRTALTPPEPLAQIPDARRNEITSVRFADQRLKDTATEKAILALTGKPLDPDQLVAIICDFVRSLPPGVNGIRIRLVRTPAPAGIRITAWSRAGKHPGISHHFYYTSLIDLNGKSLSLPSGGSRMHQDIGNVGKWKEFRDALASALVEANDTELLVRMGIESFQP